MPSNFTPNYQLNQWEPDDRVLRTDFNADNAKIDAALGALDQRGRMEIISDYRSHGTVTGGSGFAAPNIDWNDWEYVCALLHYPGLTPSDTSLEFYLFGGGPTVKVAPLASPAYLVVLLPRHDGSANAAGFVIGDRFLPFACKFPFSTISQLTFGMKVPQTTDAPNVAYFGGK